MKCQKCGAEIAEGKLYCEACGLEIQIVPDFEPEVELTISETMDHILEDVFPQEPEQSEIINEEKTEKISFFRSNYLKWLVLLVITSVLVIFLTVGYMMYTPSYQISRGNYYVKTENYSEAIKHYKRAHELDPHLPEASLYMAECYEELGNMASVEACLTEVIQNVYSTEGQLGIAYNRLALLYLEKNEYHKIHNLLKTCENETVNKIFSQYCAQPPTFSHESGEHSTIVPLKIQSENSGTIYYTTDGTDPTVESKKYTTPIFLYNGDHTIKAIYVNEYGIVSDIAVGQFKVKF